MAESIDYHIEQAEGALHYAMAHPSESDSVSAHSRRAMAHVALASLLVSRQIAEITERMQVTTMALHERVKQELD